MKSVFKEYNFVFWMASVLVRTAMILFSRTKIINVRNVPSECGLLLVANHISHLDPPMIGATSRRMVYFLAKQELFKGFIVGWFMRNSGQVPVRRGQGKDAVEVAVNLLNNGKCICIFPEGTRSRTGEMMKPRTGIVVIASQVNVPILPVLIEGTFEMMPPKAQFPKFWSKVRITYGEPFYLTEDQKDISSGKEKMRETAEMIMSKIKALKKD